MKYLRILQCRKSSPARFFLLNLLQERRNLLIQTARERRIGRTFVINPSTKRTICFRKRFESGNRSGVVEFLVLH